MGAIFHSRIVRGWGLRKFHVRLSQWQFPIILFLMLLTWFSVKVGICLKLGPLLDCQVQCPALPANRQFFMLKTDWYRLDLADIVRIKMNAGIHNHVRNGTIVWAHIFLKRNFVTSVAISWFVCLWPNVWTCWIFNSGWKIVVCVFIWKERRYHKSPQRPVDCGSKE